MIVTCRYGQIDTSQEHKMTPEDWVSVRKFLDRKVKKYPHFFEDGKIYPRSEIEAYNLIKRMDAYKFEKYGNWYIFADFVKVGFFMWVVFGMDFSQYIKATASLAIIGTIGFLIVFFSFVYLFIFLQTELGKAAVELIRILFNLKLFWLSLFGLLLGLFLFAIFDRQIDSLIFDINNYIDYHKELYLQQFAEFVKPAILKFKELKELFEYHP